MVFETKKINSETLGEYLQEARKQLDISIGDISTRTGIKQQYLVALEDGEFAKLPPDVYVQGFLKKLGDIYSVDSAALIEQYKKERDIFLQIKKQSGTPTAANRKYTQKLVITPKAIAVTLGLLFVTVTVGYIVWQVFSINKTPTLAIMQPQDRQVITQTSVTVEGRTEPGMVVSINDQPIFVNEQGEFKTQVGMGNGPKQLTFTVKNKFDKSISKTISVIGDLPEGEVAGAATSAPVSLKIQFTGPVILKYSTDGKSEVEQRFTSGSSTMISANQKIVLSTSDAGATLIELSGKNLGPLGRAGEKLNGIAFYPDTATSTSSTKY